jgi:anti-anti-sigma factor
VTRNDCKRRGAGIDVRPSHDHTTVWVSGEHDISSAPELETTLRELHLAGTDLLVDLSSLTFADSSVLRVLVQESEAAAENGCGFVVLIPEIPASAAVRRVIQLTQLEHAIAIFSSRDRATAHLQRIQ